MEDWFNFKSPQMVISTLKSILRGVSFSFKNNGMSLSVFKTVLDRLYTVRHGSIRLAVSVGRPPICLSCQSCSINYQNSLHSVFWL